MKLNKQSEIVMVTRVTTQIGVCSFFDGSNEFILGNGGDGW